MGSSIVIGAAAILTLMVGIARGVSITPVGPAGYTHFPRALNERGDVLFNATWAHPDGSNSGVQFSGPEAWFADGTSRRFPSTGADSGYSMALGDDGSVVARNAFWYPRSDGIDSLRFNSTVTSADGTDLPYVGALAFAFFETVTPDGRYLGFGSANKYIGDDDAEPMPLRPIAWDPVHGETALALPDGASGGMAYLWNPAGGSAGWTYSPSGSWAITWWNEGGKVIGGFNTDSLAFPWPSVVGVRSDGPALGSAQGQLVEFHPDGTMVALGENLDRYDQALDANTLGFILGESRDRNPNSSPIDVVLWMPDGRMLDLQTLFPPDSPWKLTDAVDITESGDVLVRAELIGNGGYAQSFIIRDIPAPGGASTLVVASAVLGVRRRRGAALASGAMLAIAGSASGVSIIPVGPAGITHYPRALNERGDVVFDVKWGEWGENPGEMVSGPEMFLASGGVVPLKADGAMLGYSIALGEDGAVVGSYGFPFPYGDDSIQFKYQTVIKDCDGADVPYSGEFAFAQFRGVTPDGAYFGHSLGSPYGRVAKGTDAHRPIVWWPASGETEFSLPPNAVGATVDYWNPGGGYVGTVWDEELKFSYVWWDDAGSVTGRLDPDTIDLLQFGGEMWIGGVRDDGAMVGAIDRQMVALYPDGTVELVGAPFADRVIVQDSNSLGLAVGFTYDGYDVLHPPRAMVWTRDGVGIELQSLLPADTPWVITDALDITESGDILVHGRLRENHEVGQAFIIRGIPSPGGVVIAACAGLMVLAYRRRG